MTLTKQQVMQVVSRYIGVNAGYLGDFSYKTHRRVLSRVLRYRRHLPRGAVGHHPGAVHRDPVDAVARSAGAADSARLLERFPVQGGPEARAEFQASDRSMDR